MGWGAEGVGVSEGERVAAKDKGGLSMPPPPGRASRRFAGALSPRALGRKLTSWTRMPATPSMAHRQWTSSAWRYLKRGRGMIAGAEGEGRRPPKKGSSEELGSRAERAGRGRPGAAGHAARRVRRYVGRSTGHGRVGSSWRPASGPASAAQAGHAAPEKPKARRQDPTAAADPLPSHSLPPGISLVARPPPRARPPQPPPSIPTLTRPGPWGRRPGTWGQSPGCRAGRRPPGGPGGRRLGERERKKKSGLREGGGVGGGERLRAATKEQLPYRPPRATPWPAPIPPTHPGTRRGGQRHGP